MRLKNAEALNLKGQFIISTPIMDDTPFKKTVVLVCGHTTERILGPIINHLFGQFTLDAIFKDLNMEASPAVEAFSQAPVFFGGPLDLEKGVLLHSTDYYSPVTVDIAADIRMSIGIYAMRDIAQNKGPAQFRLMLGNIGWPVEQILEEIKQNSWLVKEADAAFLYSDHQTMWERGIQSMGIDPVLGIFPQGPI